ncbi:hypothetical protein J132_09421 [Termitomyces sp. J132]|nr:hypothetical protein J132_09421 [Termitomyces sp. J132]
MSTIHHAAYWAYVRRAFIAHGETAESIADALNEYPVWFTGTTSVSDANAILADSVIIWRTWTVWGRSWRVAIVPTICTLLMTAFSIMAIFETVTSTTFGAVGVDYATALYSTSLITTLYCTAAIVYRVVLVNRYSPFRYRLRSYRGVIEILVESSALYFIATLFALVAYICSGPASEFASAFWTSITTYDENRNELGTTSMSTHTRNSEHVADAYVDDVETSVLPRGAETWELHLKKENSTI